MFIFHTVVNAVWVSHSNFLVEGSCPIVAKRDKMSQIFVIFFAVYSNFLVLPFLSVLNALICLKVIRRHSASKIFISILIAKSGAC